MSEAAEPWWKAGVIYQVYPRSFQDSDGDGIGDLEGVRRRLPYLKDLGVDAVWLSPIYPSPMADFGYDVADYCDVDPRFGTLADFDALIAEAHGLGLKLLLDLVPNHTSDQHPWFQESRSSRENPRRDWYIWRDLKPDGSPPNNWISDFGGSAWELDPLTGQAYLHAFLKEQPDLNWRNPAVEAAMLDVLRFWFDRGVDGFRIDVLWHMVKAEDLRDNPPNPAFHPGMGGMHAVLQTHSTDQPEVFGVAERMRAVAEAHGGRLLIGEIYLPFERLAAYYGAPERPGVQLPFNFSLIEAAWEARRLHALIAEYEGSLPGHGWPNWVLGNHDRPRVATRVGPAQSRVAAMLLLTLRGTPTIYYGDELGLTDGVIPPERVQDPRELREPGLGLGRDPVRTPMPWDAGPGAGFTTGDPWLPLNPGWERCNVAAQAADPASMLTLHKALLALRRAEPALALGDLVLRPAADGLLAYERRHGGDRLLITLNLSDTPEDVDFIGDTLAPLLSTLSGDPSPGRLRGNEGVVWRLG